MIVHGEQADKQLIAYYVAPQDNALSMESLRVYLTQYLPDYMIPSQFVKLEALPLTSNGKVDRKALPKSETKLLRQQHVPPGNEIEATLATIWCNI